VLLATVLAVGPALTAGCAATSSGPASGAVTTASGASTASGSTTTAAGSTAAAGSTTTGTPGYTKVMVIVEENETYSDVLGSAQAPYLAQLATQYGSATAMQAGYPASCPSLAAYIILTSGSDHGICDDRPPSAHPLDGGNLFQQVATSGRQWRVYAESMQGSCAHSDQGVYLVRHTAAPYYLSERDRCAQWDVPMGTADAGALHDDVTAGTLPAFSLVVPDACDDMHGAASCDGDLVAKGDSWLRQRLPAILAGADYRAGRLLVIITWDEGSATDNHIPTLVISPTSAARRDTTAWTHCSTLRTIEDLLRLPALGCAAQAAPFTAAFNL
jgi:phosphatidylinositol-3-phosphatase